MDVPPLSNTGDASLGRRLLLAAAVLIVGAAASRVILSQPPEGRVMGTCVEKTTGRPLAHISVWLSRSINYRDNEDAASDDGRLRNPLGQTTPPGGWKQALADDRSLDAAGALPRSRDYLQTRTDAQGHFFFAHVRAGAYQMGASGPAWNTSNLAEWVEEGVTVHQEITLDRATSSLQFDAVMRTWTPGEKIVMGLNGLVIHREISLSLDRLDLDGTLIRRPSRLVNPGRHDDTSEDNWAGEYTPVHRWVQKITRADEYGSFYQRIAVGALPAGIYRLTAETIGDRPQASSLGWIRVTPLALVRKSTGSQILAFITDIRTGKPVAHLPITLYDEGNNRGQDAARVLASTTTSPQGLARLSTAGAAAESQGVLVARGPAGLAAVTLDLNTPGEDASDSADTTADGNDSGTPLGIVPPGSTLRSFTYTDRPIYRPGQTVYFKGIVRWYSPRRDYVIPVHRPVTLDIRDAQETLVSHQDVQTSDMGSWHASLNLSPEALTGEYTIRAAMDGTAVTSRFAVAAYHKPEYEVKVSFAKDRYVRGETIQATVAAIYYFGAPVSGASLHYSVFRDAGAEDMPDGFNSASTEDQEGGGAGEPVLEKTVRLDSSGQISFEIPTEVSGESSAKGPSQDDEAGQADQNYRVEAEVDDHSGRTVTGQASVTVAQGEFSLQTTAPGICSPGSLVEVSIRAADARGAPLAGQDLDLRYAYRSWIDGKEKLALFRDFHQKTGRDGLIETGIRPPQTGLLTVRAAGVDRRGNRITSEDEVWVTSEDADIPAEYPDLSLVLDAKHYSTGDTAHLLINTRHPGPTALITLEGTRLYRAWTVDLHRRSTAVDLKVTRALAPGVTLSVCCVRDKQFLSSSTRLNASDGSRNLQVMVTGDHKTYHPGDPAILQIRTLDDKGHPVPAEVSVGVVDSAIYAIRPEPQEGIREAFLPDQGDAVQTGNSCEQIYLGDADKGAANITIRKRFPDTALWSPDVRTGPDGNAVVHLNMPDTLTTWRVTCVGHTRETAVGKATCSLIVNKDLLVRLEAPVFLVEGDASTLVALAHNNTRSSLKARITLRAPGLAVKGELSRTIDVLPGDPARTAWIVGGAAAGIVHVQATVVAGSLSDGVEAEIPILPHGAYRDVWQAGTLLHRVEKTVTLDAGAIPGSTRLDIRLSPTVSSAMLPALDYLEAYPYGSTDTTTSVLIPDAILAGAAGKNGKGAFALTPARAAHLAEMVDRSLLRLYRFQKEDGGWGWWETGPDELWMTAYATWGITLARDAGFSINKKALESAANQMQQLATVEQEDWKNKGMPEDIAITALTLARSGHPVAAARNVQFLRDLWQKGREPIAYEHLAMLALAEHTIGGTGADSSGKTARQLMNQLWAGCRPTAALCAWPPNPHNPADGVDQQDVDVETTAWALAAAEAITPADPRIDAVARWLMANRNGDHWSSTRTTAIVLLGLAHYMAQSHELQPDFVARVRVNGALVRELHFDTASINRPDVLVSIPGEQLRPGHNSVILELKKNGQGRLYYSLELRQCMAQPRPQPPTPWWKRVILRVLRPEREALPFTPSGYRIKRVYLRLTSRRGFFWEDSVPVRETQFQTGESILVRLIIDSIRPGSHLLVEEPIPAGCTVTDTSGDSVDDWENWWDFTDVRDDKIVFFISDFTRGEHEIDYHLQAKTPGQYDVTPPLITGAFDPTLHALGNTAHIAVE